MAEERSRSETRIDAVRYQDMRWKRRSRWRNDRERSLT